MELNHQAAAKARSMQSSADIITADILDPNEKVLTNASYDLVVSLSCV
tara:strand:- start:73 stop:216 length:144 start_codon:yes stop_codon:yes gene_type:complete